MPTYYAYYHMTVAVSEKTVIGDLTMKAKESSPYLVYGSACFVAATAIPIRCTGNVWISANCNQTAANNITGIELCGTGDQFVFNNNTSAGAGWVDGFPIILNKKTGAVNVCHGAAVSANAAQDPLVLSAWQSCPALKINDVAASGITFYSLGPIRIAGTVEAEALTLAAGVSASYPNIVEIPDGATLSTDKTVWNTNCLIDGVDSDSDKTRDSFGIYGTRCTAGIPNDAGDANYNVADGVIKTCRVEPPPLMIFCSPIALPCAASNNSSPVRLAEFAAHTTSGLRHIPTGNNGTLLVRTEEGPAFRSAVVDTGTIIFN